MRLNEYGKIARDEWHKTGLKRPEIGLDEFIIMDNPLRWDLDEENPLKENIGRTY